MSKGNKRAKNKLIQKYGQICMIEEAGIRKIPISERKKIKGYKKSDDQITFHHLIPRRKGGQATPENGALVKDYNHRWLEHLPSKEREQVNNKLREFKLNFSGISISQKGLEMQDNGSVTLDFDSILEGGKDDVIEIPVFQNTPEDMKKRSLHKTRAQRKIELQKEIDEYFEGLDER